MNKYILCAMDKSKIVEELEENRMAAFVDWDSDDISSTIKNITYVICENVVLLDYFLSKYFAITGENREDYENKIQEINR